MYKNNIEVSLFLESGGTLVVPSRQRAAAVSLAYSARQFALGLKVWNSPDVLPWQAWLQRERERAAASGNCRRILGGIEQWLVWRDAVAEAASDDQVLMPLSLVEAARRSSGLMDDWGLQLRTAPTDEARLLLRVRSRFAARRAALPALDDQAWRAERAPFTQPVWLLGFDGLGSASSTALRARGARIDPSPDDAAHAASDPGVARVCAALSVEDELERMTAWCRAHLLRDAATRLLVVVPPLARQAARVRRALVEALESASMLGAAESEPLFALEGGAALGGYRLVAAALGIIRLSAGRLQFPELSTLLRSSYIGCGGIAQRTRLELWLRDQNVTALDSVELRRLCAPMSAVLDPALLQSLEALLDVIEHGPQGFHSAPVWARHYANLLQAAGWPGEQGLTSGEHQVRQRFDELLGEFATLGEVAGAFDARDACSVFAAWVERASLEPASGDVPVTVTDSLDDPVVQYDGIWVCGLSADVWPPAPVPDAFLPFGLLEAAGVEAVTPAGQLRRARRAMDAWRRCSADLVLSWPQHVDDAVLEPSPLLPPAVDDVAAALPMPPRDGLLRLGATLEVCGPDVALPWSSGERVRGGTRLLQAQADCPFRASAEWRLKCAPIESPAAGIDARIHGQIVHGALERIWRQLGGSAELQHLGAEEMTALVSQAVAAALNAHRQRMLLPLPAPLWQVERRRCEQLVRALLVQERKRDPFVVAQIEQAFVLNLGELSMQVRLDRLDRLTGSVDGVERSVLLDYKTGRAVGVDWLAERPQQAQLLAYAMSAGAELCALSAVHLHRDGIRWAGIADQAGRLPKVPAAADLGVSWPELRARWQQQLQRLGERFVAGEASVDPQRDACSHCHLQLLCRIDAATAVELTSYETPADD